MRSVLVAAALVCSAWSASAQPDPASAPYRYRAAIAALMQLKPGMVAAEISATRNTIAPEMQSLVGTNGRVIAATLDRATGVTNLEPASVDAVVLVSALTAMEQHQALFEGIARAVKPGGVLLVVDVPQENDGTRAIGLEADDVVKFATAAGFKREAESGIVPGHYAIRFRRQQTVDGKR